MNISIQNLGTIETAEIELNGITVLSGYNDTGKSFIGKLIFGIIQTLKNAHRSDNETKGLQIARDLERISISHFRITLSTSSPFSNAAAIYEEIKKRLPPNPFSADQDLAQLIDIYRTQIFKDLETYDETNSRVRREELSTMIADIESRFNSIKLLFNDEGSEEAIFSRYFQSAIITDLFDGNINTLGNDSVLTVRLTEGSATILSLDVEKNQIISFKYDAKNNPLFRNDTILIETPTVLSLDKYFYQNLTNEFRARQIPLQYYDLLTKIRSARQDNPLSAIPEISKLIATIIGGEVSYNDVDRRFVYKKKNQSKVSSDNIATGIKSFALLQMLCENGHITAETVLVLDEPEVHLHPEWEILYARLLFALSKAGVLVLLTTHSSYFVQAIETYASEMDMENQIHFYFGKKNDTGNGLTTFSNVTDDLNPIFKALAKPMQDIYK